MSWLQASIVASQEQAPVLEPLFEDLGALSVTFGDAADDLEPDPGDHPLWLKTRVTALFEGTRDVDELTSSLVRCLPENIAASLRLERLADQRWERAWLDAFRPMRFGERLWVCPHGQRPETKNAVIVELDPGLAFGTGTHATTALCLEWLDGNRIAGMSLIDYGCGSGILAVAALRLGAAQVTAIDHDPQALEATRRNGAANGVSERLHVCGPDRAPRESVDALLANILAEPLIQLSESLSALVKRGGRIVLSGIIFDQVEAVTAAYRPSFSFSQPVSREGWARLVGVRERRAEGG